jgi:hypothetical protein
MSWLASHLVVGLGAHVDPLLPLWSPRAGEKEITSVTNHVLRVGSLQGGGR